MEHDPTNARLIERVDLTKVLSIVKVRPDSGSMPPPAAGQFFRLGLPRVEIGGGGGLPPPARRLAHHLFADLLARERDRDLTLQRH